MAGEDPHFVGMSGTHLMQVLSLVEVEPPDFIVNSGRYSLDVETTQMALTILDERIESGNR
ncbi:MAG: hypothetical protein Rhims3KO_12940 [Hyphomicrobiales bacterium]